MMTIRYYLFFALLTVFLSACGGSDAVEQEDLPPAPSELETDPEDYAEEEVDDDEAALDEMIRITSPQPDEEITLPYTFRGEAVGSWFFEADFPVLFETTEGDTISFSIARAQGEWMTTDFVPFEGVLEQEPGSDPTGLPLMLTFIRSNPSDDPSRDLSVSIPVTVR